MDLFAGITLCLVLVSLTADATVPTPLTQEHLLRFPSRTDTERMVESAQAP